MSLDAAVVEKVIRDYAGQASEAGLQVDVDAILAEVGIVPKRTLTLSITIDAEPAGTDRRQYVRNYVINNGFNLVDQLTIVENNAPTGFVHDEEEDGSEDEDA